MRIRTLVRRAAAPIGPYSQVIRADGFIFVAGEKGIGPQTNQTVPGGIVAETRQTLENIDVEVAICCTREYRHRQDGPTSSPMPGVAA